MSDALLSAVEAARAVSRVRCVLRFGDRYLFVQHRKWRKRNLERWALPGGRIKHGESADLAIRREMAEELFLVLPNLLELGDYGQGGKVQRLYGCELRYPVRTFSKHEIAAVRWLTHSHVMELAFAERLHRGFELAAVERYADLLVLRSAGRNVQQALNRSADTLDSLPISYRE